MIEQLDDDEKHPFPLHTNPCWITLKIQSAELWQKLDAERQQRSDPFATYKEPFWNMSGIPLEELWQKLDATKQQSNFSIAVEGEKQPFLLIY